MVMNEKEKRELLSELEQSEPTAQDASVIWSLIDLTSLNSTDTETHIKDFCAKITAFNHEQYGLKSLPAVCVYPQFAAIASRELKDTSVKTAAVAGAFPTGQTFTEVKIHEVEQAVAGSAREIDVVINRGLAHDRAFKALSAEIQEMKKACGQSKLKVILETGEFSDLELLRDTCDAVLESGADFLKTSTGKIPEGATLEKGLVLTESVHNYFQKTGERRGVKFSGGIRTAHDAAKYLKLVKAVSGADAVHPRYLRVGASSLAKNLLNNMPEVQNHPWE